MAYQLVCALRTGSDTVRNHPFDGIKSIAYNLNVPSSHNYYNCLTIKAKTRATAELFNKQ